MTLSRRTLLGATASAATAAGLGVNRYNPRPRPTVRWSQLSSHLQGRLVLPADAAYATAKQLELGQYDQVNPQAVAYCAGESDIATCLSFAQDHGLPFAIRSGGHSGGGYSTSHGIIIDVSGLNQVSVGQDSVTIGAGCEGVDVINALGPQGLVIPGGYCPTVGVGGYYQGGGIGPLTRSIGLGVDRLQSAQVVLADGRIVTASADENPDLYWALRGGGGGNFGVVTSFDVTPVALSNVAFAEMQYEWSSCAQMLSGFTQWLVQAPRTIMGYCLVQLPDAAPGATPSCVILLSSTGTTDELTTECARLASLTGTPQSSSPAFLVPYESIMMGVYGCSTYSVAQCHRTDNSPGGLLPREQFGALRSRLFNSPPPLAFWEQVAALFETRRIAGQAHLLEMWAVDGAVHDPGPADTAFVHRDSLITAGFLSSITTATGATPAGCATAQEFVDAGFALMNPYSSGRTYQNFMDPLLPDWQSSYYGANYERLARVKRDYDPYRAFSFAQAIR